MCLSYSQKIQTFWLIKVWLLYENDSSNWQFISEEIPLPHREREREKDDRMYNNADDMIHVDSSVFLWRTLVGKKRKGVRQDERWHDFAKIFVQSAGGVLYIYRVYYWINVNLKKWKCTQRRRNVKIRRSVFGDIIYNMYKWSFSITHQFWRNVYLIRLT